jgi:hypothetical protein
MSMARDIVTIDPVTPNLPAMRFHLLGDDELTGGVGGWEVVARPRRKAAAEWGGTDAWTLSLPLMATGMESSRGRDASIEGALRALIAAGTPSAKTGQPPVLKVTGPVRVPSSSIRWVIQSIEWGAQIRNNAGQRVQQEFTLALLEYVEAAVLLSPAKAAKARNSGNWAQQILAAQQKNRAKR